MALSNSSSSTRLELLSKDNFDTWSMQVEALLTKNELWDYVSGVIKFPGENEATARATWIKSDQKARADLILSIQPSELKHIRNCATSHEVWLKLESVYASKGPARKATLLKKLMLHKLEEGGDIREHIAQFFDAVDKLEGMKVPINGDLLTIMLLYSLPPSFDNFRCAIESRDTLPDSDTLKSKIIEEGEARKESTSGTVIAMTAACSSQQKKTSEPQHRVRREFKCFKCGALGHMAKSCPRKNKLKHKAVQKVDTFYTTEENSPCLSWVLDSGCTTHLCGNKSDFLQMDASPMAKINMANQASAHVEGQGEVMLTVSNDQGCGLVKLKATLYVPELRANLISVAKITDKGGKVVFTRQEARVYDNKGDLIMTADRKGDLFHVRQTPVCSVAQSVESEVQKWHCRLGHLNSADLGRLARRGIIPAIKSDSLSMLSNCKTCLAGKMSALPFSKVRKPCNETLKIVYTDVVGPFRTQSHEGARYFVSFLDDCTRWAEVYFLREKSGVFEAFKAYKELIEKRTGKQIKSLHSDNGREYVNNVFNEYLTGCGIERRLTIPHTPQQNGVAERFNRTILDMARCLIFQSGLTTCFWARAVSAACYLRNRCPSSAINWLTPCEKLYGSKPKIEHLRIFGSNVMILDKTPTKGKLDPRAIEGVFVGYPRGQRGYLVWLAGSRQIVCARDVKFISECGEQLTGTCDELLSSSDTNAERSMVEIEIAEAGAKNDQDGNDDELTSESGLRRVRGRPRIMRTGEKGRPRKEFCVEVRAMPNEAQNDVRENENNEGRNNANENENNEGRNNATENEDHEGPTNATENDHLSDETEVYVNLAEVDVNEALNGSDADEWLDAIECEVINILKFDTWNIITVPECKSAIGCRFVLTNKCGQDGKIERRKARLVAKGYSQEYGVNYYHTFAPVARLETLRLMLALSVQNGFSIWQFDVVSAYLHGELEEKILMKIPNMLQPTLERIKRHRGAESVLGLKASEMLRNIAAGGNVCLLKKALYGLKQAGRQWYRKIREKLEAIGLTCAANEPCLFFGQFNDKPVMLLLYVDDMLIACESRKLVDDIKCQLSLHFEIKDLGLAVYCLGLELKQSTGCIKLSQEGYINMLLKQYGMYGCNPVTTPAEVKSVNFDSVPYEGKYYRELIGCLMYLSVATRPDIANAVSRLAQFITKPMETHWQAAKRILRYLAGTCDKALKYQRVNKMIVAYTDSDWGGCTVDRRSYSGYVFILSGAAISWKSQKQKTVALSSTEAEYISLAEAAKEGVYLQSLLMELKLLEVGAIPFFVDNRGAMCLANNPVFHGRTKHIDIKHHFVRECINRGVLKLQHVPTESMLADFLTKPVTRLILEKCLNGVGLC